MRKELIVCALAAMLLGAAAPAAASPAALTLAGQTSSASGELKQSASGELAPLGANEQVRLTPQQAVELFTKQAEEGKPQAMLNMANFYENGVGVPRNFSTSLEWYLKAGEAGQPEGYQQAGISYEMGRGVTADRAAAVKYLELAAEKKVPGAAFQLAALSLTGPQKEADSAKALKYLKDMGLTEPQAMETLGAFYENGQGVPQNFTRAFTWYKKAAEAGLAEGHFRMGQCYELGLGVAVSYPEAAASFQKAADLGLGAADFRLAALNMTGFQGEPDVKKMLDHLNKSMASGYSEAANELGVIYLEGRFGQAMDQDKAMDLFLKGSDLGNPTAMKNVAVMYRNGVGRKVDQVQALKWYIIAGAAGYQHEGFGQVIDGLKKDLKPEEVKKAEEEAEKWVADFNAKNNPEAAKK